MQNLQSYLAKAWADLEALRDCLDNDCSAGLAADTRHAIDESWELMREVRETQRRLGSPR